MKPEWLETVFELSSMQKGVLFHTLYAPDSSVYVNQSVFTLEGELNARAFELAWQKVIERHQVLRCSFFWEGLASPVQVVHRQIRVLVKQLDWSHLSLDEQETEIGRFLDRAALQPFDLCRPPQMRLTLIRAGALRHYFVWTRHHILFDGWSQALLLKELFTLYEIFCYGEDSTFDEIPLLGPRATFEGYIRWLQENATKGEESFWRLHLDGFRPRSTVCTRTPSTCKPTVVQRELTVQVEADTMSNLDRFRRRASLTMSSIDQAAWALVLASFSGSRDVVFGLTMSGRHPCVAGVESMIGLFINTLPVRAALDELETFETMALKLQRQQARLNDYQHTALTDIHRWSDLPPQIQLFDNIVVIGNYPTEFVGLQQQSSLRVTNVRSQVRNSLPLTLRVMPGDTNRVSILYDEDLINSARVAVMLKAFVRLLETIPASPRRPIVDFLTQLSLLQEANSRATLEANIQRLTDLRAGNRKRA